ncbi:hypothetical protein QUF72_01800 [Desulfobacterales bacterium HSG2]|nr:hypothetical protein [Desulfobacterales bacterium HSG2]
MYDLIEIIFYRVCVCRTFQLSGLQAILSEFPINPPIEDSALVFILGDLARANCITIESQYCIVRPEKASELISKLTEPSFCELNDVWRKWYKSLYEQKFRVYDLANYLYHEISYVMECTNEKINIYDYLKSETEECLWKYYHSNLKEPDAPPILSDLNIRQALRMLGHRLSDPKRKEAVHYIKNLRELMTSLKLFEGILSESECEMYIDYLKSLEPWKENK